MFQKGDLVFHTNRGAGIITAIQSLSVGQAAEAYYAISLATGETLLTPIREGTKALLAPVTAPQAIVGVLSSEPETLHADYRQRTLDVEEKLDSGDPLRVAEALRDLTWRQHTARLSGGDVRLISKAHKLLSNALAVKPKMDLKAASQLLDTILQKVTAGWEAA